jgi:type II secretory pathway pseudopilin PulG
MGIGMATAGKIWSSAAKRDKEEELLFRGNQIGKAIESYYISGHGGANFYPKTLNDLLKDNRSLTAKRYLRKLYTDPMTEDGQWEIINDPLRGGIRGVRSKSEKEPIKQKNFPLEYKDFEGKKRYKDWEFVHVLKKKS